MSAPTISGRDHMTDINGDCLPDCLPCYVLRLEAVANAARRECMEHEAALDQPGITIYRTEDGPPRLLCGCALCAARRALDGEP